MKKYVLTDWRFRSWRKWHQFQYKSYSCEDKIGHGLGLQSWNMTHIIWVIWFQVQDLTEVDPGCFTFLVGKCLELPVVEDLQFLQCQLWVFLEIARPLVEHVPTLGLHQLDLIDLDWLHCCLCCLQDQHIELIVGKQEGSQQIEDWQRLLICVASK